MSASINLITTFYIEHEPQRAQELRECLRRNIENIHITKIYVLVERGADTEPLLQHPKVVSLVVPIGRQTYAHMITVANHYCQNEAVVFSNTDTYFDDSIALLPSHLAPKTLFVLTRRDLQTDGSSPWTFSQQSSDAWAVRAPITAADTQIEIGLMGCESLFVGRMLRAGYEIHNVSLDINCFHLHISQKRNYDRNVDAHSQESEMAYPVISGLPSSRDEQSQADGPVVIDGVALTENSAIASFWLSIFREWQENDVRDDVVVLDRSGCLDRPHTLSTMDAPPLNNYLISSVREINGTLARKRNASLFLSTGESTALGVPSVVVATSVLPEILHMDTDRSHFNRGLSFQLSDVVLCASTAIRETLEERYHHLGASKFIDCPLWYGIPKVLAAFSADERAAARQRLALRERHVVFAGERSPSINNANLHLIAHALREIGGVGVVFIGGSETIEDSIRELFEGIPTRRIAEDSHETILTLAAAEAFIAPQLGEEEGEWAHIALSASCPLLRARWHRSHSDRDGTIFFDTTTPEQLVAILRRLIQGDREAVGELAAARTAMEAGRSNGERIARIISSIRSALYSPRPSSAHAQGDEPTVLPTTTGYLQ
jgi:hypothetical protein